MKVRMGGEKNLCVETQAGRGFQKIVKNKSKKYLVRIDTGLSLRPALQKRCFAVVL